MNEKADFLSEEFKFRIENLKNEVKNTWNNIWDNREIKLNDKQKKFDYKFYNEILPKFFENLSFNAKFKLLKIYEVYEDNLKNSYRRKRHSPKIPSAKEIYKWLILKKSEKYKEELKNFLNLEKSIENNEYYYNLPKHAYLIEISFKLKKPYISRDDEDFYIIDNPIVKDKVFKVPMVRASTWKGALRFAAEKVDKNKGEIIKRLFGNDKRENENQKRGRLTFYPTFFDSISLEVITPLDRETKTPSLGPIYFETVPKNTNGKLRILYYPYDLIAVGEVDRIEEEAKEDFEFLGEALRRMFYEIGFSAKKTSGFGVVEINEIKIIPNNELSEKLKKFLWEN